MSTLDDQPRPDFDAAIDAVVLSLSAVSDDAAAASLRRTRVALAERTREPRRIGIGRVAVAAAAIAAVTLAAVALWRDAPLEQPRVAVAEPRPAAPAAAAPLPTAAPRVSATAIPPAAPTSVRPGRLAGAAMRAPEPPERSPGVIGTPVPDRIADLIRVVQAIPEDAWSASRARVENPVVVAEVPVAPIAVAAIDTPRVGTLPADEYTPGEP
jgi:hypothetical protein